MSTVMGKENKVDALISELIQKFDLFAEAVQKLVSAFDRLVCRVNKLSSAIDNVDNFKPASGQKLK
jgi:hypothetical protein